MPGDTATVRVSVSNLSAAINGVQVLLNYDTSILTLTNITPTDLGLTEPAEGWVTGSEADVSGDVTAAFVVNGGSIAVDHTVATLTFNVIAEGTTTVTFRADDPPFETKLTRASDNATLYPTTADSGNIVSDCDDGLFCNGEETFSGGSCQAGTPPCDDSVACTDDSCDEVNDVCVYTPNDTLCDNGLYCDGAETCDALLGCQAGADPCDDEVGCTDDSCEESTDTCTNTPNDTLCDNGDWCDGAETCDGLLDCQAGTAPDCDDSVACTVDTCDEVNDECVNTATDALCDNGNWCDGAETCDALLGCQDNADPDCDDSVSCTVDTCDEVNDVCVNTASDALCDDGDWCNGSETCDAELDCQAGTAPNCSDSVPCTDDTCDEVNDVCVNTPNDANCDNGDWCDGAETCHATLDCQSGTAQDCDDSVDCTDDTCDEVNDVCVNTANDTNCDDGDWCNGSETCDAELDCQAGTSPDCSDSVGCTVDTCDEVNDECVHTPSDALCDNGQWCDGVETCDADLDCQAGTTRTCTDNVDCTDDTCDEVNDICVNTPNDANCDNGDWCDGAETCHATLDCQDGPDPNCADSVACTVDTCDEVNDTCVNTPTDSLCDNGNWCDGAETCDAVLGCQDNADPDCNDSVACTDDSCDEVNDVCVNAANDSLCDNGLWCDGAETCDALAGCQGGTAPDCDDTIGCTDDSCDEVNDTCVNATNDTLCDNGQWCDGAEYCDAALDCQNGTAPDCDDTISCTVDTCDEVGDVCVNTPDDAPCQNADWCDGAEVCDALLGCIDGADPNCDDSVGCTDDSCDEVNDVCVNTPNDTLCDNGDWCDGSETCHSILDCQAGTSPDCSDSVGCTDDTCDEINDECVHTPNDASCDDGFFCTGVETCDALLDCQSSGDPCGGLYCNDVTDTCDACVDETDCDDNNVCTTDTCETGACVFTDTSPAGQCCDPITGDLTTIDDGLPCTTDICNADGTVSHVDAAVIDVNMKLQAITAAVTRDVTFVITTCGVGTDVRVVPVAFNAFGIGTATLENVDPDAEWISVREGHTLSRLKALTFASCSALVDFSGADLLLAGDFQTATVPQDDLVDIVDFSILASRFHDAIDPTSSLGADATADGIQDTADFTAIQVNYFRIGDAADGCGGGGGGGGASIGGKTPVGTSDERLSILPTHGHKAAVKVDELADPTLSVADINADGVIDSKDIRAFATQRGYMLMPAFDAKLTELETKVKSTRKGTGRPRAIRP